MLLHGLRAYGQAGSISFDECPLSLKIAASLPILVLVADGL